MEEHYSQAQATYELVLGYGMQVPAMDMAAYRTITADMEALQHAVEIVEARQEEQTEAFGRELAAGHCMLPCSSPLPGLSLMHELAQSTFTFRGDAVQKYSRVLAVM